MQLLPLPISSAIHVWSNFSNKEKLVNVLGADAKSDKWDKKIYNDAVKILYNTAIAVAGYIVVRKFGDKWHNGLLPVALVAANVFPYATWFGTTGYGTAVGVAGVVHAIKQRNPTQLAAHVALTLISYFGTTINPIEIHHKIKECFYL